MNLISKYSSHRYFIHTLIALSIVVSFGVYRIYIWTKTQYTDNAYIEAEISNVSSEVSGIISEILVEENNKVIRGQIIAKIKDDDYRANYEKTLATLEGAKRDIEIIDQNIKLAQIDQKKAKESLEFAEANLKLIQVDYNRIQALSKDNYASKQKLDNAEIALEKAKNEFSQAELNMQTSLEKLTLLELQRLSSMAKHTTTAQEVILAKRNLDNTLIRSPINGTVGNSSLKLGNYITAGVVLFAVVPEKLYVKANFKETQITNFKTGMEAVMIFDSEPDYEVIGYIRNLSPATGAKFSLLPPSNATGNFTKIVQRIPVSIDFDIPEKLIGKLSPGMSTIVKIRTDQEPVR
ncbi:HlyD family secretion protein [Candidatus Megaera polyxenophila]|nr:HlyD family secretion protein [Candidatus Megaera polyxenophila]